MLKVFARVAMEFSVNEELFKGNPSQALQESLKNNQAVLSDGDNYLPEPWNEGLIEEDVDFSLGVHPVRIEKEVQSNKDKLNEENELDNHMYSTRFLETLSEHSLKILMEEHGYEEGYEGLDKKELIEQLSTIEYK